MKSYPLAIVIPAYKLDYLSATLESIANQTSKNFTLYIGDDASPYDIYKNVIQYEGKINIQYKRFEENLGRSDLVAQWERCIDMIQDEKWIWLFSDDDIMEKNCIEIFYQTQKINPGINAFHFNCSVINSENEIIYHPNPFPEVITASKFFDLRIKSKTSSFISEYIFKKKIYDQVNGFEKFPLGWCTDNAFWIKIASYSGGIRTIKGPKVYWRFSNQNISSISNNKVVAHQKLDACKQYLTWANNYFASNSIAIITKDNEIFDWYYRQLIHQKKIIGILVGIKYLFNVYKLTSLRFSFIIFQSIRFIYQRIR